MARLLLFPRARYLRFRPIASVDYLTKLQRTYTLHGIPQRRDCRLGTC